MQKKSIITALDFHWAEDLPTVGREIDAKIEFGRQDMMENLVGFRILFFSTDI